MKILLVEDDTLIAKALEKILGDQHYVLDVAIDGQAGWEYIEAFTYDLVVLDVNLPKLNGIELCQQLRSQQYDMPVLLLTAQSSSTDKVAGLDAGADDYIVKPFDSEELLARIRVLLRRPRSTHLELLEWQELCLDVASCEATYGKRPLSLTPKEYRLLEFFLRHPQRVFSRSTILDFLWSSEEVPGEDTVTVHINELRRKLKRAGATTELIETVYGQGYRLARSQSPVLNTTQPSSPHRRAPDNPEVDVPSMATNIDVAREELIRQQTKIRLHTVWEKHKGLSYDRCQILKQTRTALLQESLSPEQQQMAHQAAHKLAGALGIFGFVEETRWAREIEHLLHATEPLKSTQVAILCRLIQKLSQSLTAKINNGSQHSIPEDQYPLMVVIDDDVPLVEQVLHLARSRHFNIMLAPSLNAVQSFISRPKEENSTPRDSVSISDHVPDVVLLNLPLQDVTQDQLIVLEQFIQKIPPIPILFLLDEDNWLNRIKVSGLGVHAFLEKPPCAEQVLQVITNVRLQLQNTATTKVMLVDDDPQVLVAVRTLLEPWGIKLKTLAEPQNFWQTLTKFSPDLLVLDVNMPYVNGVELCRLVRNTPQWRELPIVCFTVHTEIDLINQVLTAGANTCISKTLGEPELVTQIFNHIEQTRLLRSVGDAGR